MIPSIATKCVEDLISRVSCIGVVSDKTWSLIDEDQLFNKSRALPFPCLSVVYEGLLPSESAEGRSAALTCSLYLLYNSGKIGNIDFKPEATALLDSLRDEILGRASPAGHKWTFKFESPADSLHGAMVFYQRWTTNVIL